MNVFENVKEGTTAKEIAYKYLGRPNRIVGNKLWYNSPFRSEKIPSFMVTDSFHDFGEGWHGDGVDLLSRLYRMKPVDAARMIAKDFGLPYENEYESEYIINLRRKEREEKQKAKEALEKWFNDTFVKVCETLEYLRLAIEHLAKYPVAKCLAQSDYDYVDYIADQFVVATTTEEKLELYKNREVIERWTI